MIFGYAREYPSPSNLGVAHLAMAVLGELARRNYTTCKTMARIHLLSIVGDVERQWQVTDEDHS